MRKDTGSGNNRSDSLDHDAAARTELSRPGVLLRCEADGELSPAQREALDALLQSNPGLSSAVAAERRLRDACGRAIGGDRCPADLRAKIGAIAQAAREQEAADVGAGLQARASVTRQREFWTGWARPLGVMAAVLTLAFTAFWLGSRSTPVLDPAAEAIAGTDPFARIRTVSEFVSKEHSRCFISPDTVASKFTVHEADAVPEAFQSLTGIVLNMAEVFRVHQSQGLRFVDAGRCSVPGDAPGMHIRFRREDPSTPQDRWHGLSLFVQPATGWLAMEDGRTYRLEPRRAAQSTPPTIDPLILAWQRDGILHYLVADEPDLGDQFRVELGLPEPNGLF